MTFAKPAFNPCNIPNSRNATTTDNNVKMERAGLRRSPAQIRTKYFTPQFLRRQAVPYPCEFDAWHDSQRADRASPSQSFCRDRDSTFARELKFLPRFRDRDRPSVHRTQE